MAALCFGDSGGPALKDGYVVGDTSYGYTNNCRYLGGYQRVDVPVVRDWLLDCLADLVCERRPRRRVPNENGPRGPFLFGALLDLRAPTMMCATGRGGR